MDVTIREDMRRYEANETISRACLEVPRLGSSKDKKDCSAKILALTLFPVQDSTDKEMRKHSYIQYTKLISRLKKRFLEQLEAEKEAELNRQAALKGCGCNPLMIPYKKARLGTVEGLSMYYQLLNNGPQDPVTNPVAMPVEVSPLEDLSSFFDYLKTGGKPLKVHSDECGDYIQFLRGAFYTDGRIDLCKQVVGPDHIQTLMDSILENESVQHFLLGNNIIGPVGAKAIGDYMTHPNRKSRIQTWYIAGNSFDGDSIKYITEPLKSDTDCDSLWLKRNPLRVTGTSHIADMLRVNSSITTLDLHNTAAMDEGAVVLFEALKYNTTLRYLCFTANSLGPVAAKAIADYFDYISTNDQIGLTHLDIGMNPFGDSGAEMIIQSLVNYPYLTKLNLNGCRIQQDGLRRILRLLPKLNLELLDLGLYKASPDLGELPNMFRGCGTDIVNYLKQVPNLRFLYLSESHLSLEDMRIITEYITTNDTLAFVQISQYGITSKDFKDLYKTITEKCQQNSMSIYGKHITVDDLRRFRHGSRIPLIDSIYRNNM